MVKALGVEITPIFVANGRDFIVKSMPLVDINGLHFYAGALSFACWRGAEISGVCGQ